MTSKRLKKLWMSKGVPRDTADYIIKHITMSFSDGHMASNQEKYDNFNITVERIKK